MRDRTRAAGRKPDATRGPHAGDDAARLLPISTRQADRDARHRCWSRNRTRRREPRAANAVTLYDVARLAGVSTATVSRVVHGLDRVRDSTRARVLDVIDQLGYVPDGAAQSLSRRQKNVIGLVGVERTRAASVRH